MFSQTVEYALRALMCLAGIGGAAVTNETVASRTNVPPGYLSKIMRDFVVAELVKSFRGPHGGFALGRDPAHITILDVLNAVDPGLRASRRPGRARGQERLRDLHEQLDDLLDELEHMLRHTTLAEVMRSAETRRIGAAGREDA
jgi:Rrf2 family protein